MRVAIIGEGFGGRVVAPVYRTLGFEAEVVSPRDTDGIKRVCAADVDLVSIHSPPFLHHAHVMLALDHHRAVLCDKPFGRNAREARAMRDRAREAGVLNFLNFEFRRQPSRVKLHQLLAEGVIGTLQHVSWSFIGSGLRRQKHRWLFDAELSGGWIGAYGSHAIDALRWLSGSEIADCGGTARIETRVRPDREGIEHASTAEDAYSAWFVLGNGVTASMDTAYSASVNMPHRIILMGSTGSLELVDELTIVLRRADGESETFDFSPPPGDIHEPGLTPWLTEVRDALHDKRQISPNFDDGVAVAEAMDLLRSKLIRVDGPASAQ